MPTSKTAPVKNKKAIIAIAAVVAVGGILLLLKYLRKSKVQQLLNLPDAKPDTPAAQPAKASSASVFPLKNGSAKSNLVSQLQGLLGVNADGLFGPKTEAALVLKTGKRQIASQTEYDAVIKQLQNSQVLSSNRARVDDIIARWNANPNLQLFTIGTTTLTGVTQDAYGALHQNGKTVTLKANYKFNRADYSPVSSTVNGFMLLKINNGVSAGLYKCEATKLSLA